LENYKVLKEIYRHKQASENADKPDDATDQRNCRDDDEDDPEAIRVEVTWLLAASFIKEVYHPGWLANPVLVRKKE
jgi:hypothetical protein